MPPKLQLHAVSKRFGETTVLHQIDLSVYEEEFLVLVGPSGCGKSTILRLIAGLETLSDGSIDLEGKSVHNLAPKDRDIAMVFQNYALYPHMSVYDNMAFGLKMRKTPKDQIKQRVEEAAHRLQLGSYLKRKPKELSGGQRQRVALGRAIVRQPKVFLMDEPLSNLDAKLRQHMRYELATLHKSLKATTLYVTHDQTEALTLGHRIVVLEGGSVQQVATPRKVYDQPANRFVAGFIGQMNLLELQLEGDGTLKRETGLSLGNVRGLGQLPTAVHEFLASNNAKPLPLVVGFRPESATAIPFEQRPDGPYEENGKLGFALRLERFEVLGSEKLLYLSWPVQAEGSETKEVLDGLAPKSQASVLVRVAAHLELEPGAMLWVETPAGQLHWFAGGSNGARLL